MSCHHNGPSRRAALFAAIAAVLLSAVVVAIVQQARLSATFPATSPAPSQEPPPSPGNGGDAAVGLCEEPHANSKGAETPLERAGSDDIGLPLRVLVADMDSGIPIPEARITVFSSQRSVRFGDYYDLSAFPEPHVSLLTDRNGLAQATVDQEDSGYIVLIEHDDYCPGALHNAFAHQTYKVQLARGTEVRVSVQDSRQNSIPHATISTAIDGLWARDGECDEAGVARLRLPPGAHVLTAGSRGFCPKRERIELPPSALPVDVSFSLEAVTQLTGVVVDSETGLGLADVIIRTEMCFAQNYETTTDENGLFSQAICPPTKDRKVCVHLERAEYATVFDEWCVPEPYDGSPVRISLQPCIRIRGRLADVEGNALPNCRVAVSSKYGWRSYDDTSSGEDGVFTVHGVPSQGRVEMCLTGYAEQTHLSGAAVVCIADVGQLVARMETRDIPIPDLVLQSAHAVGGVCLDSAGEPESAARVRILRHDATFFMIGVMRYSVVDRPVPVGDWSVDAVTNGLGRFRVVNVCPGTYTISVERNGAAIGSQDVIVSNQDLDVTIQLRDLRYIALKVICRYRDTNSECVNAVVLIVPRATGSGDSRLRRGRSSDVHGEAVFAGVPDVEYDFEIWPGSGPFQRILGAEAPGVADESGSVRSHVLMVERSGGERSR